MIDLLLQHRLKIAHRTLLKGDNLRVMNDECFQSSIVNLKSSI
jgi:hypothetical protein